MVAAVTGRRIEIDGTEDVICQVGKANRDGVQIIMEGFSAEHVNVTTTSKGVDQLVTPPEESGQSHILVARRFQIDQITVGTSALGAGSYAITFVV